MSYSSVIFSFKYIVTNMTVTRKGMEKITAITTRVHVRRK
jgi:hypothetical protein